MTVPGPPSGPPGGPERDDSERDGPDGGDDGGAGHPSEEVVDALLDVDLDAARRPGRAEGGLPPPEALAAAHVLGCPRCQRVLEDMRAVRGLLRDQGAGSPLPPADLSRRIQAALAQETAREAAARRSRRLRTVLALAASVAVVGGAGALAVGQLGGLQPGGSAADQASGSAGGGAAESAPSSTQGAPVLLATGTDYALDDLTVQVPALMDRASSSGVSSGGEQSPADEPLPDVGSDADGRDLPADPGPGSAPAAEPESGAAGGDLADAGEVEDCLVSLGAGDVVPRAVDDARWEGRPATVVVAAVAPGGLGADEGTDDGAGGDDRLRVWVVEDGCEDGGAALLHYEVMSP